MTQVIQTFLVLTSPSIQKTYDIAKAFQYLQMCCTLFNRHPMMKWNSTMWHTTEMFEGTCVSTTHPHVLHHANKTPVLRQVMTCLQDCSPYTPLFNTVQIIVITITCHLRHPFERLLQRVLWKDIPFKTLIHDESLMTQVIHSSPSNRKQYTGVSLYQFMFTVKLLW